MANEEHLSLLKQSVEDWNKWRYENLDIIPDLSEADLSGANLNRANLTEAKLGGANLGGASLSRADLSGASLSKANLMGAYLMGAYLNRANLTEANLGKANFSWAVLIGADLIKANLIAANLTAASLSKADLNEADLREANLKAAQLLETNIEGAILDDCRIYGISAWDLKGKPKRQLNLIITDIGEPEITVDDIEVAQFIYLMLDNKKIRNVIETIAKKAVLILGRFTEERKKVLDAIREKLRDHGYLPILFDFEKPQSQTYIETIKTLALMSRFIIADFTEPRIVIQEVPAIIQNTNVPLQPLMLKGSGKLPITLYDVKNDKPHLILPTYWYEDSSELLVSLEEKIIKPANARAEEILERKRLLLEEHKADKQ